MFYFPPKKNILTISKQGLYKGNMPAEYLYLSYSAVEFWAYKELEQGIELIDEKHRLPNALNTFGCGMIAGCIATASTYPFDLLRTRFAGQRGSEKVRNKVYILIMTVESCLLVHKCYKSRA